MWLEREDCFEVLHSAWSRCGSSRSLDDLESKLEACKKSLIAHIIVEFKHNVQEINK